MRAPGKLLKNILITLGVIEFNLGAIDTEEDHGQLFFGIAQKI
jgi:hypothetical protein